MTERVTTAEEIDEVLAAPETVYRSRTHADRLVVLGTTRSPRVRRLKIVVLASDISYVGVEFVGGIDLVSDEEWRLLAQMAPSAAAALRNLS
jgi:hypothetical protein